MNNISSNTGTADGQWHTIAQIESDDLINSHLIVQYGSAHIDFSDERSLANDLEVSFLYNCWLIDARKKDPEAKLILHEKNGQKVDASEWSEAMLQQWIDRRRKDFMAS